MSLSPADLRYLADCAVAAARAAGRLVAHARPQTIETKPGARSLASQVVTDVDAQAQAMILEALAPSVARFDLGVLTEERADDGSRHAKDHFWSIDPLDGTLPFIEGRPGYAVSIALVSREGTAVVGAVYDPVERTLLHAARGLGLWRDGQRWDVASTPLGRPLSVWLDRSFASHVAYDRVVTGLAQIADELGLGAPWIHATGGAVMNACDALGHPPACYFKLPKPDEGGGSLWDYAATACVYAEAGAVATDIHGAPLDLNRAQSTFMNHRGVVFATDDEIARRVRALAATVR